MAEIEAEVHAQINDFASRGLRCIGVARAEDPEAQHWIMSGLLPLFDPPREDTKETIETALRMGVRVKMITGDQLAIAQETARRLGMGSEKIYTAVAFNKAEQEELARERTEGVKHHRIDGDISPFHKMIEDSDGFAQVCFSAFSLRCSQHIRCFPKPSSRLCDVCKWKNTTLV